MALAAEPELIMKGTLPSLDQRIGELLFESGTLTDNEFKRILAVQREQGGRFGEIALRLGLVTELDVRRALAQQCEGTADAINKRLFSSELSIAHHPTNKRAEAIRSLRSELSLRWFSHGRRMLAVTEACRQHGAPALAANLAWSCAQLGQRTVLIDVDLRAPQQQTLFKLDCRNGLSDFLIGQRNFDEVLMPVPGLPRLSLLFTGRCPANPQELLSLATFGHLLDMAAETFDVVLVSGSPLLESADMQVVAAASQGCIINVRRHRTRLADLERAQARLAPTGAVLVGLALED